MKPRMMRYIGAVGGLVVLDVVGRMLFDLKGMAGFEIVVTAFIVTWLNEDGAA